MFNQVVSLVANMITQIFNLTFRLFDGLGATEMIFGAFSVLTIYRFLLAPLFGRSVISGIIINNSKAETDEEWINRYVDTQFESNRKLEVH